MELQLDKIGSTDRQEFLAQAGRSEDSVGQSDGLEVQVGPGNELRFDGVDEAWVLDDSELVGVELAAGELIENDKLELGDDLVDWVLGNGELAGVELVAGRLARDDEEELEG